MVQKTSVMLSSGLDLVRVLDMGGGRGRGKQPKLSHQDVFIACASQ